MRTSMAQDRLSNLAILHIERNILASLSISDIVTEFASSKQRRLMLK